MSCWDRKLYISDLPDRVLLEEDDRLVGQDDYLQAYEKKMRYCKSISIVLEVYRGLMIDPRDLQMIQALSQQLLLFLSRLRLLQGLYLIQKQHSTKLHSYHIQA